MLFLTEAPKLDIAGALGGQKVIKVKAGDPINVDLPIKGAPAPKVTWQKNGDNVTPNDHVSVRL